MNAVATSAAENGLCESDSDSNSDDSPEYYQPLSTTGENEDEEEEEEADSSNPDPNHNFHRLPNGWAENGVESLDLSDKDDEGEEDAIESERAIERAFREDERRRNAPLPAENAVRVMEAMRGFSLGGGGAAPDWAGQISEDQWIDRLLRLRRPSSSTASAATDP